MASRTWRKTSPILAASHPPGKTQASKSALNRSKPGGHPGHDQSRRLSLPPVVAPVFETIDRQLIIILSQNPRSQDLPVCESRDSQEGSFCEARRSCQGSPVAGVARVVLVLLKHRKILVGSKKIFLPAVQALLKLFLVRCPLSFSGNKFSKLRNYDLLSNAAKHAAQAP